MFLSINAYSLKKQVSIPVTVKPLSRRKGTKTDPRYPSDPVIKTDLAKIFLRPIIDDTIFNFKIVQCCKKKSRYSI